MSSLEVLIPSTSFAELKYTLHCILVEFLDLTCSFKEDTGADDVLIKVNKSKIRFTTSFFSREFKAQELTEDDLPVPYKSSIKIGDICFNYVSLFGGKGIDFDEGLVTVNFDVLGDTFFMLSRWEEFVNKDRDLHDRFPAKSSLALKYDFLDRPVVNEFVEIIWALLKISGFQYSRKKRHFKLVPTHDVDVPFLWEGNWSKVKSIGGQFVTGNIRYGFKYLSSSIKNVDPYDTYDLLMTKAEESNSYAHFFFMPSGSTKYDRNHDIAGTKIRKLFEDISSRGHIIGFHPSYNTYIDASLLGKEKDRIENVLNQKLELGRHHYLRFQIPTTWKNWDDLNMKSDSTVGYADHAGFRCGVCYEFPVYDILQRKMLNLKEMPLIVMEVTLKNYQQLSAENAIISIKKLKRTVQKYNGDFVFLWHNSCLKTREWEDYLPVFNEMYQLN